LKVNETATMSPNVQNIGKPYPKFKKLCPIYDDQSFTRGSADISQLSKNVRFRYIPQNRHIPSPLMPVYELWLVELRSLEMQTSSWRQIRPTVFTVYPVPRQSQAMQPKYQ
jgi:hypothetical protein